MCKRQVEPKEHDELSAGEEVGRHGLVPRLEGAWLYHLSPHPGTARCVDSCFKVRGLGMNAAGLEEYLSIDHFSPLTLASYSETVEGKILTFFAHDFPRRPLPALVHAGSLGS